MGGAGHAAFALHLSARVPVPVCPFLPEQLRASRLTTLGLFPQLQMGLMSVATSWGWRGG